MATKTTFKDVWVGLEPDEKQDLADRLSTSVNVLSQAAHGHFEVQPRFAKLIEIETGKSDLFPVPRKRSA